MSESDKHYDELQAGELGPASTGRAASQDTNKHLSNT